MSVWKDLRPALIMIVMGTVLVFVGMAAASIAGGVGVYVVETLDNATSNAITSYNINFFSNQSLMDLFSTVFVFAGISLLVAAVAFIIRALWTSVNEIRETASF